ncbi:hypothetical protein CPC08DRAFT_334488 [Agrocybe pediades]|nr:hypothetical protein CPC08DRAFT_334488 [Agrocybe pediades]
MHVVPSGRALGGGSSVNFMMYMRPAPSDYVDWETNHGNKGWGSKELIPLLKKAETYQPNPHHPSHGYSGPLKISFASGHRNQGTRFKCFRLNGYQPLGDTAALKRRAKVVRVIFEGKHAVGVEYINDEIGRVKGVTMAQPILVRASRLVVLSAGAFGTPSILERSGVGSAEVLKKHGVKQIIDLPGVGENYMDHNVIFSPYHPSEDAETMDMAFRGNEEEVKRRSMGKGVFANNGIDAAIKLRPNEAELQTMSAAFDERWKSYYANKPDRPVMLLGSMAAYVGLNPAIPRGKYFSCCTRCTLSLLGMSISLLAPTLIHLSTSPLDSSRISRTLSF